MTKRRLIQYMLLLLIVTGGVYALTQLDAAPRDQAVLGEAAPLFTLADLQGQEIQLEDYEGKGVLLNFWASWCNPCVNELPLLNEAYKLAGVEMLAINVGETAETAQKFVDRYELEFPVVLDTDMKVKQQYRVVGLPRTILINKEGEWIHSHEGELTDMADILELVGRIRDE